MNNRLTIRISLALLVALPLTITSDAFAQVQPTQKLIWQSPASRSQKILVFHRLATQAETKKLIYEGQKRAERTNDQILPPDAYHLYSFVLVSKDGSIRKPIHQYFSVYYARDGIATPFDTSYDNRNQVLTFLSQDRGELDIQVIFLSQKNNAGQQKRYNQWLFSTEGDDPIHITSAQFQGSLEQHNLSIAVRTNKKLFFKYRWNAKTHHWDTVSAPKKPM